MPPLNTSTLRWSAICVLLASQSFSGFLRPTNEGLIATVKRLEAESKLASPIGSMMPWVGTGGVPKGWAICNGQDIVNEWEVDALRDLGFEGKLPDYSGRFLGGVKKEQTSGSQQGPGTPEDEDWHTVEFNGNDRDANQVAIGWREVPKTLGESGNCLIYSGARNKSAPAGFEVKWQEDSNSEIRPKTVRVHWLMRVQGPLSD